MKTGANMKLNISQIVTIAAFAALLIASAIVPGFSAYMDATPWLKWGSLLVMVIVAVKVFPGIEHHYPGNDVLAPDQYSDGSKPATRYAITNVLIDVFGDKKAPMQRDCPVCHSNVVLGKIPAECTFATRCAKGNFAKHQQD